MRYARAARHEKVEETRIFEPLAGDGSAESVGSPAGA